MEICSDHEKLQLDNLSKKIEEEPSNPYHYYSRGKMRDRSKFNGSRVGAIEDFTQVITIVLAERGRYSDIDLCSCYFSMCQNANIKGDILMDNEDFTGAAKYYELSISSAQEFLKDEDRNNSICNDVCKNCIRKSSELLMLIHSRAAL
jgi:hypothetical protein